MTEIIPGIYQIQMPLPIPDTTLGHINIYLVKGSSGYLLVDTGWDTKRSLESLKKQLAEIGAEVKDISQIVVTHIHPDHYGLVGRLKQLSGAKVYIHRLEKDLIESRYVNMEQLLQQIGDWLHINGAPADELPDLQTASARMARFVEPTLPDVVLQGGETIETGVFTLRVLWTPGHSPGHICLHEPEKKALFSGDHILPTITPNVGLHPQSSSNPLGDFIRSLNEIKQLDIDIILPGHENPFTGLKPRIDEVLKHHRQRSADILAVMQAEPKTAYQIARNITWQTDIGGASWRDLSPLDKRLAMLETIAHLELMRNNGEADKFFSNSTAYYANKTRGGRK